MAMGEEHNEVRRAIDSATSALAIRTRAKGLLSKLAHDLEIEARGFSGDVVLDGDAWSAELSFPVAQLAVVGVLRGDRVDRAALSASDRQEIERRLREAVLVGPEVRVRARGKGSRGEVTVEAPRGSQRLAVTLDREGDRGARVALRLSLKALGVREVKGPLGAFKVDDSVEVLARFVLSEAP